jgi:hypothetical protein
VNIFQLLLLVLALVLALCATFGATHPRFSFLAGAFASFVAASLVVLIT